MFTASLFLNRLVFYCLDELYDLQIYFIGVTIVEEEETEIDSKTGENISSSIAIFEYRQDNKEANLPLYFDIFVFK